MGKHKKSAPAHKTKKFRPQDPFYKGPVVKNEKNDHAPRKDVDASDIPRIPRGAGMFGGGAGGEHFGKSAAAVAAAAEAAASAEATKRKGDKALDGLSIRQRKLAKRNGDGDLADAALVQGIEPSGAFGGKASKGNRREQDDEQDSAQTGGSQLQPEVPMPHLPNQRKDESAGAYGARLDAAVQAHLQQTRRKMLTDNRRIRRKQHDVAKKTKTRAKVAVAATENSAPVDGRIDRPKFGDIVERPPVLGSAAMASRTKLKGGKLGATGGSSSLTSGVADFSDYANRVRGNYEAMKKKRQQPVAGP